MRDKKVAIQFLSCLYCDRSIHGSFLFSSCSSWENITFNQLWRPMHNFIKAQQHMRVHIPIYSVLLKFEPEKQHQPQNLQELQNPIRPFTQSPSCLSISHFPFWRFPTSFLTQFMLILPLHYVQVQVLIFFFDLIRKRLTFDMKKITKEYDDYSNAILPP